MYSRVTFFRIFFAVLLTIRGSCATFRCPPARSIEPCKCFVHPQEKVRCGDISSLNSIRLTLEEHFSNQSLPRLHLRGIHSVSLPPRVLGNLALVRFILSDSNIRHIDDDAFAGQESLAMLVLVQDRLQDIPAGALKRLTGLQNLGLAGNFLMRIQEGSLNHLTGLGILMLADNRISEIDKNAFPRHLKMLVLSRNHLSTFNESLLQLHDLEDLSATDNRLISVQGEFDALVRLKRLHLDRNHLSEISNDFSNLKSIEVLTLSGNRIQDVGKSLTGLVTLRVLNLSHNYISELHWRIFEKLKDMESLDISGNYIKTICPTLKPLRSLIDLNLSDLNLKSLEPDCFHNMKSLSSLDLSYNRLTNADTVSRYPLRALRQLRLGNNRLTDLKYDLKYARNLRHLDISFNNFSSFNNNFLAYNKELSVLQMGGNPWQCTETLLIMLKDMEKRGVEMQGRPDC